MVALSMISVIGQLWKISYVNWKGTPSLGIVARTSSFRNLKIRILLLPVYLTMSTILPILGYLLNHPFQLDSFNSYEKLCYFATSLIQHTLLYNSISLVDTLLYVPISYVVLEL